MASIAFFYVLIGIVDTDSKVHLGVLLFLVLGSLIALAAPWGMMFSGAKLPIIPHIYRFFPDWFPRRIHFNYVGGILTFFFPLAFWSAVWGCSARKYWLAIGPIIIRIFGRFTTY
jgi:hypothetical protein